MRPLRSPGSSTGGASMSTTIVRSDLREPLDALEVAVEQVGCAELDQLSAEEELALVGQLERLRRRLDAGTDRAAGHLDRSAAFSLDGHKSAKGALKAIGRLSGAEAHGRVQTARALRELPLVAAAYERGEIPVAHVRAISRVASNPRVVEHLPGADAMFAEQAAVLGFDDFVAALREWERLADADGADQGADESHERRHAGLVRSDINGSWSLDGSFGAMQGAVMGEVLDRYERAELLADWAEALYAIFVGAASTPADAVAPEPRVNVAIDQRSFEESLRRAAGEDVAVDPNDDLGSRRRHAVDDTPLHPAGVLAAALVGHVRRVVVDGRGTVIDLGTRQRLITGSPRAAAPSPAALTRRVGGL